MAGTRSLDYGSHIPRAQGCVISALMHCARSEARDSYTFDAGGLDARTRFLGAMSGLQILGT